MSITNKGQEYRESSVGTVSQSPALSLLLNAYALLIDQEWALPHLPLANDQKCVYLHSVSEPDRIYAACVFEMNKLTKSGWIVLTVVDTPYRGMGMYQAIHSLVEKHMIENGMTQCGSHVHVENEAIIRAAESEGYTKQFYRMNKRLF